MKELSIEQKAKAYDKAVINGSRLWECGEITRENYEYIFPELKESEDDRIRKHLISLFEKFVTLGVANECETSEIKIDNILSWLEKQGKENPLKGTLGDVFDDLKLGINPSPKQGEHDSIEEPNFFDDFRKTDSEVEPNFKIGDTIIAKQETCMEHEPFHITNISDGFYWDGENSILIDKQNEFELYGAAPKFHESKWITNGDYTWKIVEIKPLDYILQSQDGNIVDDTISHVDEQFHSFTIKDAKDGDVLACGNDIVIFKENNYNPKDQSGCMFVYCSYQINQDRFWCNEIGGINPTDFIPATKEQRDLLFQKMKETGYEWDAEKKELKKIEQKPWSNEDENVRLRLIDYLYGKSRLAKDREDGISWLKSLKNRVQPKQKWSKFDDQMLEAVLYDGENALGERHKEWIKSLKNRVQFQQEWSEEDIVAIDCAVKVLSKDLPSLAASIERLKSLRPQNRWKKSLKIADLENYLWWIQGNFSNTSREYRILGEVIEYIRCTEPQNTWKPSEEQIDALDKGRIYIPTTNIERKFIDSLLEDLKKLMDELL